MTLSDDALAAIAARVEAYTVANVAWHEVDNGNATRYDKAYFDRHYALQSAKRALQASAPGDMRALLGEVEALRKRLAACEGNVTDESDSGS